MVSQAKLIFSCALLLLGTACTAPIVIQIGPAQQPTVQSYPTPIVVKVVETVIVYPTAEPTAIPTRRPTAVPTEEEDFEEYAPDGPGEDDPLYNPYYRFTYINECNQPLNIAIHYKDLWGNWVTDGWYLVQPDTGFPIASTANRYIYIAAISVDGRLTWYGNDYYDYVHGASEKTGFIELYYDGPDPVTENDPWQHRLTCP